MTPSKLVEHFFRHEYAKLVATLSRRIGVQYIEKTEDAVQFALAQALYVWPRKGMPDNPTSWLYRVAHNALLEDIRKQAGHQRILAQASELPQAISQDPPDHHLPGEIGDDILRMLFVCCDVSIPPESQLVFALKTLCGFSIREIAIRLFISEANAYKRFSRAREQFKKLPLDFEEFDQDGAIPKVAAILKVLYVLFTEGYFSSHQDLSIRKELCNEAIRLAEILVNHPVGNRPDTCALLGLMHLQAARLAARQDSSRGLLLLEEQDRSQWDLQKIKTGLTWLDRSAYGDEFSRYHAEASIAAEHCLAPSFEKTRWDKISETYLMLESISPSPLHRLNRAIAVSEWKSPADGLKVLQEFSPPTWLVNSYLWSAVMADLYKRNGNINLAKQYREEALELAPNPTSKRLLERRLRIDEET